MNKDYIWNQFREYDRYGLVEVYRNLTKKLWSVRQNGLVIAHTSHILLKNAHFIVGKGGRKRVIREQKKNVHAFIRGVPCTRQELNACYDSSGLGLDDCFDYASVTYNPYQNETFVDRESGLPIISADFCELVIGARDPVLAIWKQLEPKERKMICPIH